MRAVLIDLFETPIPEGILKMTGISGVVNKASYKRQIKRMTDGDIGVQAPPPASGAAAAPAAAAADADPPAAAAAPEDPPAASPLKDKPPTGKGGKASKTRG